MTTPDTSAVRAWARSNGYEVADRGRLPAEVTDAYLAAQRKPGAAAKSPARKAPARTAAARTAKPAAAGPAARKSAKKAPAAKTSVRAETPLDKPSTAETAGEPLKETTGTSKPAAAAKPAPAPKPSPVSDDRRLVALGEQLAALTERVAKLETALVKSGNGARTPRFRRSR